MSGLGVFSGPHFSAFGLNTEIYFVNFRIQSECVKIRSRKSPNFDTFHEAGNMSDAKNCLVQVFSCRSLYCSQLHTVPTFSNFTFTFSVLLSKESIFLTASCLPHGHIWTIPKGRAWSPPRSSLRFLTIST